VAGQHENSWAPRPGKANTEEQTGKKNGHVTPGRGNLSEGTQISMGHSVSSIRNGKNCSNKKKENHILLASGQKPEERGGR